LGASAKITKTLKLIANAKLRDAQIKLNKVRPYILGPKRVLDPIPLDPGLNFYLFFAAFTFPNILYFLLLFFLFFTP
jgi:hypothetical protein